MFAPDAFCAGDEIRLGGFYRGNESRRHRSVVKDFQWFSAGDRLVENRRIAVDVIERCSHSANMRAGRGAGKPLAQRAGSLRHFCQVVVKGKTIFALSNVNRRTVGRRERDSRTDLRCANRLNPVQPKLLFDRFTLTALVEDAACHSRDISSLDRLITRGTVLA